MIRCRQLGVDVIPEWNCAKLNCTVHHYGRSWSVCINWSNNHISKYTIILYSGKLSRDWDQNSQILRLCDNSRVFSYESFSPYWHGSADTTTSWYVTTVLSQSPESASISQSPESTSKLQSSSEPTSQYSHHHLAVSASTGTARNLITFQAVKPVAMVLVHILVINLDILSCNNERMGFTIQYILWL